MDKWECSVSRFLGVSMASEESRPLQKTAWPPPEATKQWDNGEIADLSEPERRFPPPCVERKRKRGEPTNFIEYMWWSSIKKMKKVDALYCSVFSDRIPPPYRYPIAWTTLRQLQCRELTRQLVPLLIKDTVKAELVSGCIMYEIESILETVYRQWNKCQRNMKLGTSAFWVVLVFQQHLMMMRGTPTWSANDAAESFKLSIDGLYSKLEEHLKHPPKDGSERKVPTIEPVWYEKADRKSEVLTLRVLYNLAKPNKEYNTIRKAYNDMGLWLDPDICMFKDPSYEEKKLDVSSYFDEAKEAGSLSGTEKENAEDMEYEF